MIPGLSLTSVALIAAGGGATPPGIPQSLIATPLDSEADLSWDAVAGALSYKLYRDTAFVTSIGAPVTTYNDATVTNGVTYSYTVSAVNGGGESAQSDPAAVTPAGSVVDMLLDFSASSGGTAVTTTLLAAAEVGVVAGSWSYQRGASSLAHTTIEAASVTRFWPLSRGGTSFDAATRVFQCDLSGVDWEASVRSLPSGHSKATLTMLVYLGMTGECGMDFAHLNAANGKYAVEQARNNGSGLIINAHGDNGSTTRGRAVGIAAGWYIATVRLNGVGGLAETVLIDNATGALVLASQCASTGDEVSSWELGDYLLFSGGVLQVALPAIDLVGKFPLDSVTIPAPTAISANQSGDGVVTMTWRSPCQLFKIERTDDGGATWAVLEASWNTADSTGAVSLAYVDSTVLSGSTYSYRMRALVAAAQSATATSGAVAVVDAADLPVNRWLFNETSGVTAFDTMANATLAASSAADWRDPGAYVDSSSFFGSGSSSAVAPMGASDYTITFLCNKAVTGADVVLCSHGQYQQSGWYIISAADGTLYFLTNQSGALQGTNTAAAAFGTDVEQRLTFTRAGAVVKIYVAGVEATTVSGSHINPAVPADEFRVGEYGGVGGQGANAVIRDFRVYRRALTGVEVAAL